MIDFFGGADKQGLFVEALHWLKPRFGKGVSISGYRRSHKDGSPVDITPWSAKELDLTINSMGKVTPGLGFHGYFLQIDIADPEDEVWFKLRFT